MRYESTVAGGLARELTFVSPGKCSVDVAPPSIQMDQAFAVGITVELERFSAAIRHSLVELR